jgi:[ribosomal protein S18]-alanine N-acetyltransferase
LHTAGIHAATPAHACVLATIHRAAFPAREAWSRDVMAMQLELPATFGFFHDDGAMVLARVAADEAEILTLAVAPEQRRRGLGSALLRAAMARAGALDAVTMFLEVSVTNAAARGLYAAHGFVEAGLRRRYYADGTDALVLRSGLRPTS